MRVYVPPGSLDDYRYWTGQSPAHIRQLVIAGGGWAKVFPKKLPTWASRIRNYFNETPTELKLLGDIVGAVVRPAFNKGHGPYPRILTDPKAALALAGGKVYVDRSGRQWYEMHKAGAVYHYKGEINWKKKAKGVVYPKAHLPVFKLISPDGTGGSSEICIHNWQLYRGPSSVATRGKGKSTIGEPGQWVSIRGKVIVNGVYRGSYNYSETIIMGFAAHKLRDIDTHSTASNFYINPRPMFSSLRVRTLPETSVVLAKR